MPQWKALSTRCCKGIIMTEMSEKFDPSKWYLYTASINCVITARPVNLSVWFWSVEVHDMLKLSRILSSSIIMTAVSQGCCLLFL